LTDFSTDNQAFYLFTL